MKHKRVFLASLAALVILAMAAVVFVLVGATLVKLQNPIAAKAGERAAHAYSRLFSTHHARAPLETSFETILLKLTVEQRFDIPKPVRNVGGGMASLGPELILLTNDGVLFTIKEGILKKTQVETPENYFRQYTQTADALTRKGYKFHKSYLRFHDIKVVSGRLGNYLVISYIEWVNNNTCYRNALARLKLPSEAVSLADVTAQSTDWVVFYRSRPCLPIKKSHSAMEGHISGGRMVQTDRSTIAVANGDFHWDGVFGPIHPNPDSILPLAQDPASEYGKLLIIDVETGTQRMLSTGNRNAQGIATTTDGLLWTVEHGPHGGDELNLQQEGANFGWPLRTYGTQYSGLPWPGADPYGKHDGYALPAMAWLPSVGISGLTRISNFNPAWDGDLLASSLIGQSVFRIHIVKGKPIFSERIPIGRRIRQVHQHTGGRIVLWTDSFELIFLIAQPVSTTYELALSIIENLPFDSTKKKSIKDQFSVCLECHSIQSRTSVKAPSFLGLWNREIGSGPYLGYSDALKKHGGVWNENALSDFLSDTEKFAPGMAMPLQKIEDPEIVKGLVHVIKSINVPNPKK